MSRVITRSVGSCSGDAGGASDNRLLASVRPGDMELLAPHLERLTLPAGRILFEPGDRVTHAWFPTGAVVGLLVAMADGRTAEAGTIGREGALGVIGAAVARPAFTRGFVQVAGPALRIELGKLEAAKRASRRLGDLLDRYADALLTQVLQSVACNALHAVEKRCARCLLTTLERQTECQAGIGTQTASVRLTQERLAMMLGAHRVSVAQALSTLEAAGLIRRARGRILVADRTGLARRSCECYAAVRAHYRKLLAVDSGSEQ